MYKHVSYQSRAAAMYYVSCHRNVDDLASVWCGWAEMELNHEEFDNALQTVQRAVAEPAAAIQRRRLQASQSRDEKRKAVAEVRLGTHIHIERRAKEERCANRRYFMCLVWSEYQFHRSRLSLPEQSPRSTSKRDAEYRRFDGIARPIYLKACSDTYSRQEKEILRWLR